MAFAVVTPSYAVDAELFADLHRSVLDFTPEGTVHHVVVPQSDVALFADHAGPRCRVWCEREVLPPHFRQTPRLDALVRRVGHLPRSARVAAINTRRPLPPIRGWILQQVLKLRLAATTGAEVVLLMDSDVELVRPVEEGMFRRDGTTLLYRRPGAVRLDMTDHVRWHRESWRLLGLEPLPFPQPDYVSSFMVWDRDVVLALQQRLTDVAGRPWTDVLAGRLHLSEWTLYGVFAERLYRGGGTLPVIETSRCHEQWGGAPLTESGAKEFARTVAPDDLAIMISAKTRTPLATRRLASEFARRAVAEG